LIRVVFPQPLGPIKAQISPYLWVSRSNIKERSTDQNFKHTSFNGSLDILENGLGFLGLMVFDNDSDPLPDEVPNSIVHQMGIIKSFLLDVDNKWILFDAVVDGILGSAGLGYRVVAHLVVGAVTI
jgi:hypothetical protein